MQLRAHILAVIPISNANKTSTFMSLAMISNQHSNVYCGMCGVQAMGYSYLDLALRASRRNSI